MSSTEQAAFWTIMEFIIGCGINILLIALLARLFTPGNFGTYALHASVLGMLPIECVRMASAAPKY